MSNPSLIARFPDSERIIKSQPFSIPRLAVTSLQFFCFILLDLVLKIGLLLMFWRPVGVNQFSHKEAFVLWMTLNDLLQPLKSFFLTASLPCFCQEASYEDLWDPATLEIQHHKVGNSTAIWYPVKLFQHLGRNCVHEIDYCFQCADVIFQTSKSLLFITQVKVQVYCHIKT